MNDTPPEIRKRMLSMLAGRSREERLRMAGSMFDTARKLMRAGLKKRNPDVSEKEVRQQTFLRLYGDAFTSEDIENIIKQLS